MTLGPIQENKGIHRPLGVKKNVPTPLPPDQKARNGDPTKDQSLIIPPTNAPHQPLLGEHQKLKAFKPQSKSKTGAILSTIAIGGGLVVGAMILKGKLPKTTRISPENLQVLKKDWLPPHKQVSLQTQPKNIFSFWPGQQQIQKLGLQGVKQLETVKQGRMLQNTLADLDPKQILNIKNLPLGSKVECSFAFGNIPVKSEFTLIKSARGLQFEQTLHLSKAIAASLGRSPKLGEHIKLMGATFRVEAINADASLRLKRQILVPHLDFQHLPIGHVGQSNLQETKIRLVSPKGEAREFRYQQVVMPNNKPQHLFVEMREEEHFITKFQLGNKQKAVEIEIVTPPKVDGSLDEDLLKETKQLLAELPSNYRNVQDLIIFNNKAYIYEEALGHHVGATAGTTLTGLRATDFYRIQKIPLQQRLDIFWHETGHHIAHHLWQKAVPPSNWQKAIELDKNKYVSDYAKTNLAEDFAETILIYLKTDAGRLKPAERQKFAHRFKLLDDAFGVSSQKVYVQQVLSKMMKSSGINISKTSTGAFVVYSLTSQKQTRF